MDYKGGDGLHPASFPFVVDRIGVYICVSVIVYIGVDVDICVGVYVGICIDV
jgi:hypothetical protein